MQFQYKARTSQGDIKVGALEARSLDVAIDTLQRSNLIVTEIRPTEVGMKFMLGLTLFSHVKQKDLVVFSRQLSTLFQAKVPVTQSLRTLAHEVSNPVLKKGIRALFEEVSAGSSLSQAMSRHPNIFSRFYVSMVRAGEESGKLDDVFLYLADYLDRTYALTSKARNALMYPAFVMSAFFMVMAVMLVVVIPRISSIFDELGQELPIYTRIIIGTSEFLQHWGFLVIIALGVGGVIFWRYAQTKQGQLFVDEIKIRVPIIGGLMKKIYLARFADNLATLIVSGIPILRALEITAEVVANGVYSAIIRDAAESVRAGKTISSSLSKYHDIPPLVTQMIHIGEESGRVDFILRSTATYYQREVDNLLENFVSLIEPALIILLGTGVGILVVAVLVPLYNIASAI